MAKTPEGRVKENIKKWMSKVFPTAFGYMPVPTGYGEKGIPDHVYCVPVTITEDMVGETVGLLVGIEAKTVHGKVTPVQAIKALEIRDASGVIKTVYGSDQIESQLAPLKKYAQLPE